MVQDKIRVAILGAQERDLPILGALHNQGDVEVAFVYDKDPQAVGIEIAEILGITRLHGVEQLIDLRGLDYAAVSEPREKFGTEIELLVRAGVKLLNPSEVFQQLVPGRRQPPAAQTREEPAPRTIEDTLGALEKLLDRKELLKFLLDVAVTATESSAGSIMLYSRDADELYIAYATGLSERVIRDTRQKLGEGIAGTVARNKQPQLVTTPIDTPLYRDSRERVDIGSAISLPLLWGGRLLGVLNVSVESHKPPLDEADLDKLIALSSRISRVLDQAITLDSVQLRHREWKFRSTLGEIASKDISTQKKFTVLARYLSDLIGSNSVEIFLSTAEGDWFVLGGSNRVLSPKDERIRYQSGALSRSFLENRCLVLSERTPPSGGPLAPMSSFVYCPTGGRDARGIIVVEFSERHKLDEFLMIREAVVGEISRFLEWETRERKLTRELSALRSMGDAASSILGCQTSQALADMLAATAGLVLESAHVSVRLRLGFSERNYAESFFGVPAERLSEWRTEDHNRFLGLARDRKPFATAFLTFDPVFRQDAGRYRSVLGYPLQNEDGFFGAIIAYDKSPDDPLEDAVYTELDRKLIKNLSTLALPVLDSILRRGPVVGSAEPGAFELVLAGNLERLKQTLKSEIGRSDRYHQTFTFVLFKAESLGMLFERNRERGLALVEDITQGIKTRTRKTDFGVWIRPDTYAIITLDGGKRIRYLVSRITAYIAKDLATVKDIPREVHRISVGSAAYPGTAKSPEELLSEAEKSLKPVSDESS
jgi:GAF domain-containing protein